MLTPSRRYHLGRERYLVSRVQGPGQERPFTLDAEHCSAIKPLIAKSHRELTSSRHEVVAGILHGYWNRQFLPRGNGQVMHGGSNLLAELLIGVRRRIPFKLNRDSERASSAAQKPCYALLHQRYSQDYRTGSFRSDDPHL